MDTIHRFRKKLNITVIMLSIKTLTDYLVVGEVHIFVSYVLNLYREVHGLKLKLHVFTSIYIYPFNQTSLLSVINCLKVMGFSPLHFQPCQ